MRRDWPISDATIYDSDPDEPPFALIKISYSPETNFFQGGNPIKSIKVYVTRPPKNIWQRTLKAIKGRPVTDPAADISPVGTPTGQPAAKAAPAPRSPAPQRTQKPGAIQAKAKPTIQKP